MFMLVVFGFISLYFHFYIKQKKLISFFVFSFLHLVLGIYQLYWACVAWRLRFFNKWDYIANKFLLVILGQTNYEKFLAENWLVDVMVINNL
jgi:hypothetical protein